LTILGIDPGSRKTGYAILKVEQGTCAALDYGTIILTGIKSMPEKLFKLYHELDKLFAKFQVDCVAVEAGFYGKNAQSAYKLGYARSAAVLAAALREIDVVEYSPRKIKQAVTGNGNASKSQVKYMVRNLLRFDDLKNIREDEADACAVAICHSQNGGKSERTYRNWKEFVAQNNHLVFHGGSGVAAR